MIGFPHPATASHAPGMDAASAGRLVTYAIERLQEVGGHLVLQPFAFVDDDVDRDSIGVFDEATMRLTVATKRPGHEWATTLVHELAHVEQFAGGVRFNAASWSVFETWLRNVAPLRPRMVRRAIREVQRCEHDAERRALRLFRRLSLPVDVADYTRRANAYLWAHEFARQHRRWPKSPGWPLCPTRLIPAREVGRLPPHVASAFAADS